MKKKNIVILGSTGSIGESALDVVRQFKDRFNVLGLCTHTHIDRLRKQIDEFKPEVVAVGDAQKAQELRRNEKKDCKVLESRDGVCALAALTKADLVVIAIVGAEAIFPLLSAIRKGKTIALANKESLVVGGAIVMREAKKYGARIIPIDSEQSAIFQCLLGQDPAALKRVYLTASGGPLVDYTQAQLRDVPVHKVLAHPRWKMGKKITVDSATLMNKGLEVIEAQQLFSLGLEKIKVLIHRQALVHSMVEFCDGSVLAQMAVTDMRVPIQYALTYPARWVNNRFRLDPLRMGTLSFTEPDCGKFPCLRLAYEAARIGGVAPCVLNAANEVAVQAFLEERLPFGCIPKVIDRVLTKTDFEKKNITLDAIFFADKVARICGNQWVEFYGKRGC